MDNKLLLTVEQVAEDLRTSRAMVYNLLRAGELRSISLGKSRRIARVDLEAFVLAKRQAASDPVAS